MCWVFSKILRTRTEDMSSVVPVGIGVVAKTPRPLGRG